MKQLLLMVSLILLGTLSIRDHHEEQPYLANTLSLTCPEYVPTGHTINANPNLKITDAGMNNIDQSWYSEAVERIMNEEYYISYSEDIKSYQSPNRANNLRFTYHKDGFTAMPRATRIPLFDVNDRTLREEEKKYEEVEEWNIELRLADNNTDTQGTMNVEDNRAWIECGDVRIDYENTKEGMRQDFIIKSKPEGAGNLEIVMNAVTDLKMNVSKDEVKFSSSSGDKMQYASLKAWDADRKTLDAYFELRNDKQFAIVVNDEDAVYPVTVDPLSLAPDWITQGPEQSRFGWALSDAGDVNGDGFDDIAIGAATFAHDSGYGRVYFYYGSEQGLPDSASKFITGNNGFGNAVSSAGDVNSDGYGDVIVQAPFNDGPSVHLYYGSVSGISDIEGWSIWSNDTGVAFGYADPECLGSGDFNNDGYDDIVIGCGNPVLYNGHNVGAYVFNGSAGGISGNLPAWTASTSADTNLYGMGWCLSCAGDVNADGFDDLIVGAYSPGIALAYYGSSNRQIFEPADSRLTNTGECLSVSTAGDINNDGYDDVIIGSPPQGFGTGKAIIYFGSSTGLNDADLQVILGEPSERGFGYSVSGVSDFNGDGFDDIVVGEGYWEGSMPPSSFLYFGSTNGIITEEISLQGSVRVSNAGDVNGDGLGDIVTGPSPAYAYYGRPNIISIIPETAYKLLFEEHYFNVSLRDLVGRPISNTEVLVEIRGANPEILSGLSTDDSGNVEYFLIGYNSGIDTILASATNVMDTAFVFWDDPNPVELISFTSSTRSRDITLSWSTSAELNNSGFDVERKSDNKEWSKIGFVAGSGTTSEPKEYSYTDRNLETGKYNYRLKQLDFNGNFEYFELAEVVSIGIPDKYNLSQNYPNPFNPVTTINYDLPSDGIVTLKVYDILGREMTTLVNEMKTAGYYKIQFNAADFASGAYFYRLVVSPSNHTNAGEFVAVKKCVVLK